MKIGRCDVFDAKAVAEIEQNISNVRGAKRKSQNV